jgi:2'-5' RNA ligase
MNSLRCFVAIDARPPASEAIARILGDLQKDVPQVRWTPLHQIHLTVKFLGNTDHRDLPGVCHALDEVCRDLIPFSIVMGKLGSFDTHGKPRVVWLGIQSGAERLHRIHQLLEDSLPSFGAVREGRLFHPHFTLGRPLKDVDPELLAKSMKQATAQEGAEMVVDQLHLMASSLDRAGPTYQNLHTIRL